EKKVPLLKLPLDFPRPALQSTRGGTVSFRIDALETGKLRDLAAQYGVTLYMVFLAVLDVLIQKLGENEDIVVGTVISGRKYKEIQDVVGFFVNILCLRNYPSPDKTFTHFLNEVKECTLNAFENQDYQFETLVEKIGVKRDPSRHPLFDIGLELQCDEWALGEGEGENAAVNIPGLTITPYLSGKKTSRVDMLFIARDLRDHINFDIEYCTALFKEATMQNYINYFKTILTTILEEPGKTISEISIIPEKDIRDMMDQIHEKNKEIDIQLDLNFE
ncbi:MAG: condensation domain-containing protein, partial [Acidobacteria bacterium]|nr:condensation domain-containing protein [Acidobacteriota bacterium]